MSLLQLKVDPALKKAIKAKADEYGVPASSLARIALVNAFVKYDRCPPPIRRISNAAREVSNTKYERAVNDLGRAISQKFRKEKVPSIEEQLKDF